MSTRPLDYDRIATTYDRRYVVNDMSNTLLALTELAIASEAQTLLEVGCGTGHWLVELSPIVKQLYGLDLSFGMLAQARRRGVDLKLTRGQAGALPFADGSVDMIFTLNALHHFPDKLTFIAEAFRVLQAGGTLTLIGSDPPENIDAWYIYRYFPGTYEHDLARFSDRHTLQGWILQAGFARSSAKTVEQFNNEFPGIKVLDDPFLARDATSQLALLSEQVYAGGIQRIERDVLAAEQAGKRITFTSNIQLHMLTAWKM